MDDFFGDEIPIKVKSVIQAIEQKNLCKILTLNEEFLGFILAFDGDDIHAKAMSKVGESLDRNNVDDIFIDKTLALDLILQIDQDVTHWISENHINTLMYFRDKVFFPPKKEIKKRGRGRPKRQTKNAG